MQLPGPGVFGPPRDHDEAIAVLRRAVELGVNHIDTAQYYGPDVANELIREALHPYPEDVALVSKVGGRRDDTGAWLPLAEPADLRRDIEANLSALGVDQLAAVNLRLFESDGPDQLFDDQLSVMIQARDEGLIGGIGLSNINREHLLRALERTEIACVQNAFNLVNRESAAVLEECTARGIAFVSVLPTGGRFHAAESGAGSPAGAEHRRATRAHPGPDRIGMDAERGTQRAAHPRYLVRAAPGGEHGRRVHRAGRRSTRTARQGEMADYLSSDEDRPSRRRATTSCWICWVPSKMSMILE